MQALPVNKGRVLHFMWVDVTCHPSFAAAFGVGADLYVERGEGTLRSWSGVVGALSSRRRRLATTSRRQRGIT